MTTYFVLASWAGFWLCPGLLIMWFVRPMVDRWMHRTGSDAEPPIGV